jgi:hypothetical protein
MNIVLLGALVKGMNLTSIDWEEAIRKDKPVPNSKIIIILYAGYESYFC